MTLSVDIRHRLGDFRLDASFETDGRLVALFGPSGSGKTSLVNLIAGLLVPDRGRIAVDGRVLADTAAGSLVPMHRRRVGYVFQDARLFPHLSVAQNLRYGRWFAPRDERLADMAGVVEMLGIGSLLDRRPGSLSGGERQRVAIGRALLASPLLMLMDEPLAALDEARKAEIMPYLERLRDETKIPIVYVSHSVAEVARLASDIVVLDEGRVTAAGPTTEILRRLDLLPEEERGEGGAVLDMQVARHEGEFDMTVMTSAAGELRVAGSGLPAGARVRVRIRARDVLIATERPRGLSALNVLPATVSAIRPQGAFADVTLACGEAEIEARVTGQSCDVLGLAIGQSVFAVIKAVSFDRANTWSGVAAGRAPEAVSGEG